MEIDPSFFTSSRLGSSGAYPGLFGGILVIKNDVYREDARDARKMEIAEENILKEAFLATFAPSRFEHSLL